MRFDVAERRIVQQRQPRKVQAFEPPERQDAFVGSAMPGAEFIVASSSRRLCSRPGVTGANTMNWDCGVTARALIRSRVAVCRVGFGSGAGRSGNVAADSSGRHARRLS